MKAWFIGAGVFFMLLFGGGCAVMGMGGAMYGMGHRGEHYDSGSGSVFARLNDGKVKAVLEVPPLIVEQSAILNVRLFHSGDDLPIGDAQVFIEIIYLGQSMPAMGHDHPLDQSNTLRASESAAGVYQLSYIFSQQGRYEIVAEVQWDGGQEGEHLELSVSQQAVSSKSHSGPIRGMPRDALGIAAVVLMMGLMMGGAWLF